MKCKTFRYFCLFTSLCVFLASGCGTTQKKDGKSAQADELRQEEKEMPKPLSAEVKQEEKKPRVNLVSTDRTEKTGEKKQVAMLLPPPPFLYQKQHSGKLPELILKPEPVPEAKSFWQSENTTQSNHLKSIAVAAQHYYDTLGEQQGWISKNGRMYSYLQHIYMTTDKLVVSGYLGSGLPASEYDILLLRGSDLAKYPGAEVSEADSGFGVFAVAQQSDGRYLLASPRGKAGMLSQKDYAALLNSYGQKHGTPLRLSSTSTEYGRILSFLGLYEGGLEEYFVREIWKDNKYAVVTFSGKSNTAEVKQHILQNDNNFWEVVYPNAQTWYDATCHINQKLPDFNFELLPNYSIGAVAAGIQAGNAEIVQALVSAGYVADSSQIYYQCVYQNYGYVVTSNGARYVAYKEQGRWKLLHVASDYEARNFIESRTGQDYSFIILDD